MSVLDHGEESVLAAMRQALRLNNLRRCDLTGAANRPIVVTHLRISKQEIKLMRRIPFVVVLLLVASAFAMGQQKNPKLEAELIKMDKAWTASELKGDQKAAAMFVADDFWATNADGTLSNKADYLKSLAATTDTDTADDYSVRFFGDTAIMTHRGNIKGARDY